MAFQNQSYEVLFNAKTEDKIEIKPETFFFFFFTLRLHWGQIDI